MTETEYKQIQEVFKPVKTVDEVQRINKQIAIVNSECCIHFALAKIP